MQRLLVAVADSPASLAAARTAVALAARLGAELRAVHVVRDDVVEEVLGSGAPGVPERRDVAADSVLRHVARLAERAGVPATTVRERGDVCSRVMAQAEAWPADVIVLGRTTRHGAGEPFIGADAQRVLEFTDRPVLVVPG
jgi:nucleotide-binding universal stress UspA family protein